MISERFPLRRNRLIHAYSCRVVKYSTTKLGAESKASYYTMSSLLFHKLLLFQIGICSVHRGLTEIPVRCLIPTTINGPFLVMLTDDARWRSVYIRHGHGIKPTSRAKTCVMKRTTEAGLSHVQFCKIQKKLRTPLVSSSRRQTVSGESIRGDRVKQTHIVEKDRQYYPLGPVENVQALPS